MECVAFQVYRQEHTTEETEALLAKRRWAIGALHVLARAYGFTHALAWEYVNEAEHQEGLEYWLQFSNREELREELELYQENS